MQRSSSPFGVILVTFFMCQALAAQAPDTLWTKIYGTGSDVLFSIDQTADGGFIMSGTVGIFGDTSSYWLVRTEADGDTLWTETYGHPDSSSICQSGQLTFDGGYIMAGLGEMWLIKTDADGDTLWTRRTGGPGGEEPVNVVQTADSGYIITGNISDEVNNAQVGLIKTDSLGITQWTKTYGGTGDEYGRFVQQTADSGYIVVAEKLVDDGTDFWLLKMEADGDTTWTSTFSPGGGEANGVAQTADGGYAIFGLVFGTLAVHNDALPRNWLLIKTDDSGTLDWSQTYGGDGDDQSMGMINHSGGGFLLTGWFARNDTTVDLWLVRTDALGDTLWTTTVGDTGLKAGLGIVEIAEGEYAVVGITSPRGEEIFSGWLLRFGDPAAQATIPAAGVPEAFALHANYPNPFNPSTTIGFDLPMAAEVSLTVYDILGREVARLANRRIEAGYHRVSWNGKMSNGRDVPTGIYITRLETPTHTQQIKMVLLK
ncbi:MAG: FlgD immunoglobulin-like domain containing protein [Candidatus Neomarinimicrobiota bacterium]